jgi:hypothetical protein
MEFLAKAVHFGHFFTSAEGVNVKATFENWIAAKRPYRIAQVL